MLAASLLTAWQCLQYNYHGTKLSLSWQRAPFKCGLRVSTQ